MTAKQIAYKKSLITAVHLSKRYQDYYKDDKETYVLLLENAFGVDSSKKLDIKQLKVFVDWLNYKRDDLPKDIRLSTATYKQITFIKETWMQHSRKKSEESLRELIFNKTKNRYLNLDGISKKDATIMIVILRKMFL